MRLGGDSDCSLSGVTLNGLLAPLENRELFAVDADDAVYVVYVSLPRSPPFVVAVGGGASRGV